MRVIILTSDHHLNANIALKAFLENPLLKKNKIDVVGIVSVSMFSFNRRGLKKMKRFMKRVGFSYFIKNVLARIWQMFMMKLGKFFVPDGSRKYFEIDELARQYRLPYLKVDNINSEKVLNFCKKKKPDHLISCGLQQLVKKPLLQVPRAGSINFHPALVQKHRGVSTGFWVLLKGWRFSGVTVHFMTEGIDDGEVILQKRFLIHPRDTIHSIDQRASRIGGNLLVKALVKLKHKKARVILFKNLGKLFHPPRIKDVALFKKIGKRIMHFKNLFEV